MNFQDIFRDAKSTITIIGTNPLAPHLETSGEFFVDLLTLNKQLTLTILCESDSENFSQSLCIDTATSLTRRSYTFLSIHRDRVLGRTKNDGLLADLGERLARAPFAQTVLDRVKIWQVNLRLPVNMIDVDGKIWFSITTSSLPSLDAYSEAQPGSKLYDDLREWIDFYVNPNKAAAYLSAPREELIQLYDLQGYPRGIFPRACFYTTAYARYSIWGFVFNRRGELLLHQRSNTTKDGRGLWDKSVGGHVGLRDSSTSITAERELIEELFLPKDEDTKYMRPDLGDIIHFGEWNLRKRPERTLRPALSGLGEFDWVMFRATDDNGEPLVVTRVSDRRIHDDDDGTVVTKRTVFRSDVYLFIAPPGFLDTEEQMKKYVGVAEVSGAAQAHSLVSLDELRSRIEREESKGNERTVFTDDMLYIHLQHRDLLETFAEFVQSLSEPAN